MVLPTSADAPITCAHWDQLCDVDGFLALGRNRYTVNYVVYTDGTYFYAENGSTGVLDYGGPTNEGAVSGTSAAAVINAAIAALPADGGTVKVKTGSYPLSTSIIIPRGGITFIGQDSGYYDQAVELILEDNVDDNVITLDTRASGIQMSIYISGFYINGNSANQANGHGIYLDGPSWSVLEDMEFHYIKENAIHYEGLSGAGNNQVIAINRITIINSF